MASIDGAPIFFTLASLVLLLLLSPLALRKKASFSRWLAWMGAGTLSSMLGSFLFMAMGGSDDAPRIALFLPFLTAIAGGWLSLNPPKLPG